MAVKLRRLSRRSPCRTFDRRGRTRPQARSHFHCLSRQHVNATHFRRVARMAHSDDVDTLRQLLSDATCRVGRERRNDCVLSGKDFDRCISDVSAGARSLHDSHQVSRVCRTDKFHERERCAGDRRDSCQRTDDCLKA